MLARLTEHVAIPTGKDHRPGLDQYRRALTDRLAGLGAEIVTHPGAPRPVWLDTEPSTEDREPPISVTAHAPNGSGARILIAGHIDTVHDPAGAFRSLTVSDDGKTALGPGAADMKGGILVALTALEALHQCDAALNWTFLLNSDEETGTYHSAALLREQAKHHDFGLAIEPALPGGALAVERMGSGQFKIEVFGKSAHAGREFANGVSAVTRLGALLVEMGRMPDLERGMIVNVGPLKGGAVTNAVPDYAACWGNVRYQDPEAGVELGRLLDAFETDEDAMPRVVVHRSWNRPAKPMTEGVRELAQLARAAAGDLGQELPFESTGGVCDGNILQDAGLPTIDTLGVRGGALHTTDEWIEVASLVERAQLFAVLMLRLSKQAASRS